MRRLMTTMFMLTMAAVVAGCGLALPPKGLSVAGYTLARADCEGKLGSPAFLAAYAHHNGAAMAAILKVAEDLLAGNAAPAKASISGAFAGVLASLRAAAGGTTLGTTNLVLGPACAEVVSGP